MVSHRALRPNLEHRAPGGGSRASGTLPAALRMTVDRVTVRTDTHAASKQRRTSRVSDDRGPWSLGPRRDGHDPPHERDPESAGARTRARTGERRARRPRRQPATRRRRTDPALSAAPPPADPLARRPGRRLGRAHRSLVWALREAARREATVVAVTVLDAPDGDPLGGDRGRANAQLAAHDRLEAQVLSAIAETGVQGRSRTAVLPRAVFDALTAASRGADLVFVGLGKTLLRRPSLVPRIRRLARGA